MEPITSVSVNNVKFAKCEHFDSTKLIHIFVVTQKTNLSCYMNAVPLLKNSNDVYIHEHDVMNIKNEQSKNKTKTQVRYIQNLLDFHIFWQINRIENATITYQHSLRYTYMYICHRT